MTTRTAHFSGFAKGALAFFDELAANNERDWFQAHKAVYDERIKGPMMDLVADLNTALADRDLPLHAEPKQALFRINRDIRFSRDKSPYKTNVSAVLTRDGSKRSPGLLYLQFGRGECFIALGFYALEPDGLAAFRAGIVAHRRRWLDVTRSLHHAGLALGRDGMLARLPRGFDAAEVAELADWLKMKSFTVAAPVTRAQVSKPALVEQIADFAASGLPLLAFGWSALQAPPA